MLNLGMVYPLPKKLIEEFAKKVDKLYIFEELEPVIEEQVKAWGIECIGKEIFTRQGEYSANLLREKVLGQNVETKPYPNLPARPPRKRKNVRRSDGVCDQYRLGQRPGRSL